MKTDILENRLANLLSQIDTSTNAAKQEMGIDELVHKISSSEDSEEAPKKDSPDQKTCEEGSETNHTNPPTKEHHDYLSIQREVETLKQERDAQQVIIRNQKALLLCDSKKEKELMERLIYIGWLEASVDNVGTLKGVFKLEAQKQIGDYRVDFLINDKLVVEVDGKTYHATVARFEADRRRDQILLEQGYVVARFTADQASREVAVTAEKILRIIKAHA